MRGSNTTNTRTEIPDNTLLPDGRNQTSYYVAAAIREEDFQRTFLIGDRQTYMLDNETFMNVPLSMDQEYTVFIRLYSSLNVSLSSLLYNYVGIILFSLLICSLLFLKTVFLGHSVRDIVEYRPYTCCELLLLFYFQSFLHHLLTLELLLVQWSQFVFSSSYSLSMSLLPYLCLWLM